MADIGHNSQNTGGIAGDRLLKFIERIERLEAEKDAIAEDVKEVYAEAKAVGLDKKTIRRIVVMRKKDREKLREEEELLQLYLSALDPALAEVLS